MFHAMREGRYPLAAARTQRKVACEQAEQALREARAAFQVAELSAAAAEARFAEHAQRRSLLVTGPTADNTSVIAHLSSAQLLLSGAYSARLQLEGRRLAEQQAAALSVVSQRARAVRLAELAWQRAYAERETVERHHERFRFAERKAVERAHENEAEDRVHTAQVLARG